MKQTLNHILPRTAGLLLAVSLCMTGCKGRNIPEENLDRQDFSQLKNELYQTAASSDYLTQRQLVENPEESGLSVCYPSFPDLSENAWKDEIDLAKSLRFQLNTIDSSLLDSQDQFLYQILSDYADHQLEKEEFSSFRTLSLLSPEDGLMIRIPRMLSSLSFRKAEDVENYLILLSDLPRLFDDLSDAAIQATAGGLALTPQWIQDAANACAPYCLDAEHNSLTLSFSFRLESVPGLTSKQRETYEEQHLNLMKETVIPAFQNLAQNIRSLPGQAMKQEGLCGRNDGQNYFRHLILSSSGTSYHDISQIKSVLEEQLQNNTASMNQLLETSPDLRELTAFSFHRFSDADQMLTFLSEETGKHFPEISSGQLACSQLSQELADLMETPGFISPAKDQQMGSLTLWLSPSSADSPDQLYPALAENAFPGTFYREAWMRENQTEPVLQILSFPGWEKGWDLYARSYAFSFGDVLSRDARQLERLTLSSSLAVRALIDLQVNYYGWNLAEVQNFLSENYGITDDRVSKAIYRTALYSPGSALTACIGYLEIRQIKALAREGLGDQFTEMDFHRFLLETGPAPFSLIRQQLDIWITSRNMNALTRQK